MNNSSFDAKYFFFKAALFSLFLHLFLAHFIVFTFTARSSAKAPYFIFLGSILKKQDFISQNFSGVLDQTRLPASQVSLTPEDGKNGRRQSQTVSGKPNFSSQFEGQQKVLLKSLFEDTFEEKTEKDLLEELGIDALPPPRTPLKLDVKTSPKSN